MDGWVESGRTMTWKKAVDQGLMGLLLGVGAWIMGGAILRVTLPMEALTVAQGTTFVDSGDEEAIAAKAKAATVVINGQNPGSGVMIGKQGNTYQVLTAKHVVARADEYEILTSDGTKHQLNYRTVKKIPQLDLAIAEFTSSNQYPIAEMGNSNTVQEGATVYIAGWPHPGQAITQRIFQFTSGKISGRTLGEAEEGYELVYTNITRSGMSGGPIFDGKGRLMGIHGRAEGETIFNPDTGSEVAIKSGFNLGIPINLFYAHTELSNLPKNPTLVELFWRWGTYFHEKQEFPAALVNYRRVLAIDPKHLDAMVHSGLIEYETGKLDTAIEHWRKATQLHPDEPEPLLTLAVALYTKGDRQQGLNLASEALQLRTSLNYGFWGERLEKDTQTVIQQFLPDKTFAINGYKGAAINFQSNQVVIYDEKNGQRGLFLYDLETGREIRTFSPRENWYIDIDGKNAYIGASSHSHAFSYNGQLVGGIFNVNLDPWYVIIIWDVESGKEFRRIKFTSTSSIAPKGFAFSPDGKILATGGEMIRLWDVNSGQQIKALARQSHEINMLTFSRDNQSLISCDEEGTVKFWNSDTGSEFKTFKHLVPNCEWSNRITVSPNGRMVAIGVETGNNQHAVKLLDISTGQEIRTLTSRNRWGISCIGFSQDGQILAIGNSESGTLWDISTGQQRRAVVQKDGCRAIAFKGNQLISIGANLGQVWRIPQR